MPCKSDAASRTDRGVHALGQIVCITLEKKVHLHGTKYRLNSLLPKGIRVNHVSTVQADFHPTLDAKAKTYLYIVDNNPVASPFLKTQSWHIPGNLDKTLMLKACQIIVGKKDFKGLSNANHRQDTYRQIHCIEIKEKNGLFLFQIKGVSFLYKMVRNIVGSILHVGLSKLELKSLRQAISTKNRSLAGPCAKSSGLYLKKVYYKQVINTLFKNHTIC